MIIVNIIGGLGNQMFQYAFGYAMAKRKNISLLLDITGFDTYTLRRYELDKFKIQSCFASKEEITKLKYEDESFFAKIIRRIKGTPLAYADTFYQEPHFHFDTDVFDLGKNMYFEGYWQSEKYFIDFKDDLLEQFVLKDEVHADTVKIEEQIKNSESVSLHIRRGDYVTNVHTNSIHGTCSLEYYKQAISLIEKKSDNPQFFIFSDDQVWAKEHLNFIENIVFVEFDRSIPDHEEMYLMSKCKHNIIANSSFSWWSAWLNQNPQKTVIAPKQWFTVDTFDTKDLLPNDWIAL